MLFDTDLTALDMFVGLLSAAIVALSMIMPYWRDNARFVQIMAITQFVGWTITQVFNGTAVMNGIPVFIILDLFMCIVVVMSLYSVFNMWKAILLMCSVLIVIIDSVVSFVPVPDSAYLLYAWTNNILYYVSLGFILYGTLEKTVWRVGRKHGWIKPVPSPFAARPPIE